MANSNHHRTICEVSIGEGEFVALNKVAAKVAGKLASKDISKIVKGYKPSLKHSTTTESKISTKGEANSSIDRIDNNRNVIIRRYFDENGLAKKDVDFTDHDYPKDHPEVPHVHDWDWGNPNKPSRSK